MGHVRLSKPAHALTRPLTLIHPTLLCLQAVAWAIDELKAVVPLWKKEIYEDGSEWKENAESRLLSGRQQLQQRQYGKIPVAAVAAVLVAVVAAVYVVAR